VKGTGFVPLTEARQIPVGSQVDAREGTLRLTSASTTKHVTYSGDFGTGIFSVLQTRAQKGLTTLKLLEGAFSGAPTYASCATAGKASAAAAHKKLSSKKVLQLLTANAHGSFQTRGEFSAATVRGTQWQTIDRCDGTLTKVQRGVVVVRDFRLRRNITVRAGKSYLARP
jgi:hypothetical protein